MLVNFNADAGFSVSPTNSAKAVGEQQEHIAGMRTGAVTDELLWGEQPDRQVIACALCDALVGATIMQDRGMSGGRKHRPVALPRDESHGDKHLRLSDWVQNRIELLQKMFAAFARGQVHSGCAFDHGHQHTWRDAVFQKRVDVGDPSVRALHNIDEVAAPTCPLGKDRP